MRRVVLAPDSFKGTVTAAAAVQWVATGWAAQDAAAIFVNRPMADGGEGTLAAFEMAVPAARRIPVTVDGPGGKAVRSAWLRLPPTPDATRGTGLVELASTSGMQLLDELRPWDADTTGFGQAISAAIDSGVSRVLLGIGSSASTDGGVGMLAALGARCRDARGRPVRRGARGLVDLVSVDVSGMRPAPDVRVLADVSSPLTGAHGAAALFGPQKGLRERDDIARVDAALTRLADLLGADPCVPGAGAAGGTGIALAAWGAILTPGAAEVATVLGLPQAIANADVVVTGEGSYDGQSGRGKVPSYVAALAASFGVPVVLVAGHIAEDADVSPFSACVSLAERAGSIEAAIADPARWLCAAGAELARAVTPARAARGS